MSRVILSLHLTKMFLACARCPRAIISYPQNFPNLDNKLYGHPNNTRALTFCFSPASYKP